VLNQDVTWSYREVLERAEVFAKGLRALGVGQGDRVAFVLGNFPVFIPLAYAVWRLGATLIPINFAFQAKETAYVLRQSGCRLLVTMARFRDRDYLAMLDELGPGWEAGVSDAFPNLTSIVAYGEVDRDVITLDEVWRRGHDDLDPLPPCPAAAHDTAIIMYTSGTTGLPKGVIHTHDTLLRSSYANAYHQGFRAGRRTVFALPLYHSFGLVNGVIASIWVGGAVILQLTFDPARTFRDIERFKATDALFVPTMAMAVIEHPDRDKYDLGTLTGVLTGAAATPAPVWEQLIGVLGLEEVFTGYGMTELVASTTLTQSGDPLELVEQTVGQVLEAGAAAGAGERIGEYRTADPFTGDLLPDGVEGELVFRGPIATAGYFELPEETTKLKLDGGWLRSGDLGRVRADGYIEVTGRSKELYKTGGELVAPKEVEAVLNEHPDVAQAYVIGIPDRQWGEIGGAWVVPIQGRRPTAETLQAWCRVRLAKFKWPRHVFFCTADELPTTATGKVQKFALIEQARKRLTE
jgi:fatty-acyl-CoA synthase